MASAAAEVTWVANILTKLGVTNLKPITFHCDNQSAIYIAKNLDFHDRTKHIEIDCHYTRNKVLEGLLQVSYLLTKNQLVDVLTKILPSFHFKELLSKLGLSFIHPSLRGDVEYISSTTTGPELHTSTRNSHQQHDTTIAKMDNT